MFTLSESIYVKQANALQAKKFVNVQFFQGRSLSPHDGGYDTPAACTYLYLYENYEH